VSRSAVILLLVLVIGGTTAGTYQLVFPRVAELRLGEARQSLQGAARLMQEQDRVDETRLGAALEALAARTSLRALLRERPTEAAAREEWLGRLRTELIGLEAEVREVAAAKDLFVCEPGGLGLARLGDATWTGKPPAVDGPLAQALREAASGRACAMLGSLDGALVRVAAAPVREGERVRGVLLATFPLDDGLVRAREGDVPLEAGFAYLTEHGVAAADLTKSQRKAIEAQLEAAPELITRLLAGKPVEPFAVRDLLVVGLPVTARGGQGLAGLLAVRSVRKLNRPLDELALYLFSAAGLGLLGLAFVTVLLGGRLPRGLTELERQVGDLTGAVATGRPSGRLRPTGPRRVHRLALGLNALLEALHRAGPAPREGQRQGRPAREPTNTDMDASVLNLEEPIEGSSTGPSACDPSQDEYYRCLYDEFRVARAKAGDPVDEKLDLDRFRRKLDRQAELLLARHACKAVSFEVVVSDGKVSLRPTLER
jgi:hypothetical protein